MVRSNRDRIPAPAEEVTEPTGESDVAPPPVDDVMNPLHFIVPTEVVDLPSKGRFYPEGHPLHNCETIELKHMTAKEEDILTSTTLLKKGLALDKMLQSIIVDKKIKVGDLLLGDKNALLVQSRVFGYGPSYETKVTCPECGENFDNMFNLDELQNKDFEAEMEEYGIESNEDNNFLVRLPKSQYPVEFRLLTSRDETAAARGGKELKSLSMLQAITVSINEQTDRFYIKRALSSLPILDASILKRAYNAVTPDIHLAQETTCPHCDATGELGVPLDAGFFWPNL
mgnify:CR=1 FL=1